ncbi:hypothetical protein [Streptomyces sp. NPDC051286]|uniref:hypothetical protein n=1 Tax=Streptomyces sp. NPDC051286 TaxID=3365647 RepID=UPI0037B5EC7E
MNRPLLGAEDIEVLEPGAVDALEAALSGGLDPETSPARHHVTVPGGELLITHATTLHVTRVKIAGVDTALVSRSAVIVDRGRRLCRRRAIC